MRLTKFLWIAVLAATVAGAQETHEVAAPGTLLHTGASFLAAGSRWAAGLDPHLSLRASRDGIQWSEWIRVQPSPDTPAEFQAGSLVFFEWDSRFIEVRAEQPVTIVLIDPGRTPPERLNAIRGRSKERAAASFKPPVVSRIEWGCPDGDHAREPVQYTAVTHLIVHHTGDSFPSNDYPAWVRAIWKYHVFNNGWIDIGYNYLIDPEGVVYEGRAGGDNVLGAHFSCQNGGTMGVSLLGTFTSTVPSQPALESLRALLAWKAAQLQLDPLAQALHKGSGFNLYTISGHRDGNHSPYTCTVTECPGDSFYPMLPSVRSAVAALIGTNAASLLAEDAEQGPGAWTAAGLWHITSRRSYSASHAWWYGSEDSGNYETANQPNSGTLESPPIDVPGPATLSFRSWYETENEGAVWDRKTVEINVNESGWQVLDAISGPSRTWTLQSYPINQTGSVRIRFRFDTVDGSYNRFEGWYVDDIRVNVTP